MALTLATAENRCVLVANQAERQHARDLVDALDGRPEQLSITGPGGHQLPVELTAILGKVVRALASGGSITIGTLPEDLSTTVAAEQLGVSRPTLMKMIREEQIPAHKVGSHHRLKAADVIAARRARVAQQRQAFDELRALDDELADFESGSAD